MAGLAVMGPLGAYYGAVLGYGLTGILPAAAAASAGTAIAGGVTGLVAALLPGALDSWKKDHDKNQRIAINHTIYQGIAKSLADEFRKQAGGQSRELFAFWSDALARVAEEPTRLPDLFRTAASWEALGEKVEPSALGSLGDPDEMERQFWRDVDQYLLGVVSNPYIIQVKTNSGFERQASEVAQKFTVDQRLAELNRVKEAVLEGMRLAYAQKVASDEVLRDKSLFYLVQASYGDIQDLNAKVDELKAIVLQLGTTGFVGRISGQQILDAIASTEVNARERHKEMVKRLDRLQPNLVLKASYIPALPTNYVNRPDLIQKIRKSLSGTAGTLAHGAAHAAAGGGYGKSVIAAAYARQYESDYPGGVYFVGASGRTAAEVLASLLLDTPETIELATADRADRARVALSENPSLIILDNVDSPEHWQSFLRPTVGAEVLFPIPGCHLLVTSRADRLPNLPSIAVEKLSQAETAALLGLPEGEISEAIWRETEGIAFLVSAIRSVMIDADAGDLAEWTQYVEWLRDRSTAGLPSAMWDGYPETAVKILDDLFDRLPPAQQRAIEYAALLPADRMDTGGKQPERGWLAELLQREADGTPPLDLSTSPDRPSLTVVQHLDKLRRRDLLRETDPGREGVHRLHRKRARERMAADPEGMVATTDAVRTIASRLFQEAYDDDHHSVAVPKLTDSIAMRETLRDTLEPLGRWDPSLQNGLASAYTNRGNAQQGVPDLVAAIADYGEAIARMEAIRRQLEPLGRWDPSLQNDLASAYMNRGNAQQGVPDLGAAIADYGQAITLREAIRLQLEPLGRWDPSLQNDLASAYTNRGVAQQGVPDLGAAIADYGQAITRMEAVRLQLEPLGRWDPSLQNDLAKAYTNRGNAQQGVPDLGAAIADYDQAITLREAIRRQLEPLGRWDPSLQNDLGTAYRNRANAAERNQEIPAALVDYDAAIAILTPLADQYPTYFSLVAMQTVAYRYDTEVPVDPSPAKVATEQCLRHLSPERLKSSDFMSNIAMLLRALKRRHPDLATEIEAMVIARLDPSTT
jgi:tetratricopeptide (TPR) repeat protein